MYQPKPILLLLPLLRSRRGLVPTFPKSYAAYQRTCAAPLLCCLSLAPAGSSTRPLSPANHRRGIWADFLAGDSRALSMENQELEGGLEVLEADLAETENSVYHLVRSNVELAQVRPVTSPTSETQQSGTRISTRWALISRPRVHRTLVGKRHLNRASARVGTAGMMLGRSSRSIACVTVVLFRNAEQESHSR